MFADVMKTKRPRIFIALPISEALQLKILKWEKDFANLPVRWLQGKNLHITLVPPWYIQARTEADSTQTNAELDRVKTALQAVSGYGSFEVNFSKVAFGPEPQRPRLIWAEGETPKELIELIQKVHQLLGREEEKRPLKLHLTIARFRPETFSSFPIKQLDEKVDWRDKINRVVLFESKLSREGADYQILSEISL